jgi:hypothetical protein
MVLYKSTSVRKDRFLTVQCLVDLLIKKSLPVINSQGVHPNVKFPLAKSRSIQGAFTEIRYAEDTFSMG